MPRNQAAGSPLVSGPGIIVGRKGNVGSVFWSHGPFHPIDTVYYVDAGTSSRYLFLTLQHTRFENNDGAVPGLSRPYFYSRPYLVPSPDVLDQFESFVAPTYRQIDVLGTLNERLGAARDLLLPRLMSGEITV